MSQFECRKKYSALAQLSTWAGAARATALIRTRCSPIAFQNRTKVKERRGGQITSEKALHRVRALLGQGARSHVHKERPGSGAPQNAGSCAEQLAGVRGSPVNTGPRVLTSPRMDGTSDSASGDID